MARSLADIGPVTVASTNPTPYVAAARRLVVVPVVFVAVFTLWPAFATLRRGFDITAVVTEAGLRSTVCFTAWQAALSTVITLVVGLPVTWVLARHEFTGRRLVRALTLVPFVLPTIVVGLAFRAVLPARLHTGTFALVVAHVFLNVAVVVRIVGARWESHPRAFDEAAATLGANVVSRFRTVTWPLLRGSVTAAGGLVFMYCFTTYGAARVLAGPSRPVTETEIYRFAVLAGDMRAASALAVAQIVLVAVVLGITSRGSSHRSTPSRPLALRGLRPSRRRAVVVGAVFVAVVFTLPLVGLALRSVTVGQSVTFAAWRASFGGGSGALDVVSALGASAATAAVAAVIALVVGTSVAFTQVHARSRSATILATACEVAPVVVSAVVVGLGFLLAFRDEPFDWRGRWWLLPVAHAVVALPLVSRSIGSAMRQIPDDLRGAAATLGARPTRTLISVDASILRRPIGAAATLGALVSLGEFGASSLLTRRGNETLTMAIGRLIGRPGDLVQAQAFVAACVLGTVCLVLVSFVDLVTAGDRR